MQLSVKVANLAKIIKNSSVELCFASCYGFTRACGKLCVAVCPSMKMSQENKEQSVCIETLYDVKPQ